MKLLIALAALLLVGGVIYIRVAPSDPGDWHVDPLTASPPGSAGILWQPDGGDGAIPVFDATAEDLLLAFDRIAMAEPRVRRLAGSPAEGFVTYVARTRYLGFPDYISARALSIDSGGATLAVYSRLRFGTSDLGVNRARMVRWIDALKQEMPTT